MKEIGGGHDPGRWVPAGLGTGGRQRMGLARGADMGRFSVRDGGRVWMEAEVVVGKSYV